MKMSEAMEIIETPVLPVLPKGFAVHFERVERSMLIGDFFPDIHSGETPIETEAEAWELARKFAAQTRGQCVNIYVINSSDFTPVAGYASQEIENR